jgi:hypothetical protein
VVERFGVDQRFVRRGQQREARSRLVPRMPIRLNPAVQPADGAPRVEHRLAAHLQRPHHVRADDVVGAVSSGGMR